MRRIRNLNDVLFGSLLIAVAVLALYLCRNLTIGAATSMGPGYVPRLLCAVQIALGAAILAQGLLAKGEPFEAWYPRQIILVLASVAFFGLAIETLGIAIAVLGLVFISTFAHKGTRLIESVPLAVVMAALSVVVFVMTLKLPILVLPPWLTVF